MAELLIGLRPCIADDGRPRCPTHVQGGTAGMLGHLQLIHHPDLTLPELEEKYSQDLWPEISGAGGG